MPALIPFRLLLLLVVLGGVVYLVDRLVVTDREAIEALVERAVQTTREGDFEALGELVDLEYEGKGGSREGVLRLVKSTWSTWRPVQLDADIGEIDVQEGTGEAPVVVTGQVAGQPIALRLAVRFVEREDGWKIAAARIVGWGLVRPGGS